MIQPPFRQVCAVFDESAITVYQAYGPEIAEAAVRAGSFVPPFRRERMTWIKPSFLWMMFRCGRATKPGQERVLAIRITRAGFEGALSMASLSHFDASVYADHQADLLYDIVVERCVVLEELGAEVFDSDRRLSGVDEFPSIGQVRTGE